jgi:hypothetical protein
MHPKLEYRTLAAPRNLAKMLKNIDQWEKLLLVSFALDDQEPDGGFDPVHKSVSTISEGLLDAVNDIRRYHNMLVKLNDSQPVPGKRVPEITNCMACGEPALPLPHSGFCPDVCYPKFLEFRHARKGDRNDFIAARKEEILNELIAEQEADT